LPTRRDALKGILATTVGCIRSPQAVAAKTSGEVPIVLRTGAALPVEIAEEFVGLGYEMSSVARQGLLSPRNQTYVALTQGLGAHGVIRVGGIVADYTRFSAGGVAAAVPHSTVITEANLQEFSGFLNQVGWRAIWSVNFAQGSLPDAVLEAKAVQAALGPRLLAFELGNEVDNYGRGSHPFRPSTWDYAAYRAEYKAWHAAIQRAIPEARFAAPDTASALDWVESMATDAKGEIQLLTTHYYRANQHQGNAQQLLTPDSRFVEAIARLGTAARRSGIPWRMCEINSFSGGGLPGVSDTLVGALWTLETMLLLAQSGCSGINLETGVNQLGFLSSYSPIRDDSDGRAAAGAPYYGMLAFAEARRSCTQVLSTDTDIQGIHATAYVLGTTGRPRAAVVINRDPSRDAVVALHGLGMKQVIALRLNASSAGDPAPVSFGGAFVTVDGRWSPLKTEKHRNGMIKVPAMSAVVVQAAEA
jgi:hypothetical protein